MPKTPNQPTKDVALAEGEAIMSPRAGKKCTLLRYGKSNNQSSCLWKTRGPYSKVDAPRIAAYIQQLKDVGSPDNDYLAVKKCSYFKMTQENQILYLSLGYRPLNPNWIIDKMVTGDIASHPHFPPILPGMAMDKYKQLSLKFYKNNKDVLKNMVSALSKKTKDSLMSIEKIPVVTNLTVEDIESIFPDGEFFDLLETNQDYHFLAEFPMVLEKSSSTKDNAKKIYSYYPVPLIVEEPDKPSKKTDTTPQPNTNDPINQDATNPDPSIDPDNSMEDKVKRIVEMKKSMNNEIQALLENASSSDLKKLEGESSGMAVNQSDSLTTQQKLLQLMLTGNSTTPIGFAIGEDSPNMEGLANIIKKKIEPSKMTLDPSAYVFTPESRHPISIPNVLKHTDIENEILKVQLNSEIKSYSGKDKTPMSKTIEVALKAQETEKEYDSKINHSELKRELIELDIMLISIRKSDTMDEALSIYNQFRYELIEKLLGINNMIDDHKLILDLNVQNSFDQLTASLFPIIGSIDKRSLILLKSTHEDGYKQLGAAIIPIFLSHFKPFYLHKILTYQDAIKLYTTMSNRFLYANASNLTSISQRIMMRVDTLSDCVQAAVGNIFALTAVGLTNSTQTSKTLQEYESKLKMMKVKEPPQAGLGPTLSTFSSISAGPSYKKEELSPSDQTLLAELTLTKFILISPFVIPMKTVSQIDIVLATRIMTKIGNPSKASIYSSLIALDTGTILRLSLLKKEEVQKGVFKSCSKVVKKTITIDTVCLNEMINKMKSNDLNSSVILREYDSVIKYIQGMNLFSDRLL